MDFIWQIWTSKKRGYMTISADSVDAFATLHIFIEPNKKGELTIVERIARFQAISRENPYFTDDFSEIVSVSQIEKNADKSEYRLIFKDKFGETSHAISNFLD